MSLVFSGLQEIELQSKLCQKIKNAHQNFELLLLKIESRFNYCYLLKLLSHQLHSKNHYFYLSDKFEKQAKYCQQVYFISKQYASDGYFNLKIEQVKPSDVETASIPTCHKSAYLTHFHLEFYHESSLIHQQKVQQQMSLKINLKIIIPATQIQQQAADSQYQYC